MVLLGGSAAFTPAAAIQAATEVNAMVVGRATERGTIAPGMDADLKALSADQSADARKARKIVEVITNGRVFRPVLKP
jgi:imidazolonepropionase-like amidohydrolase